MSITSFSAARLGFVAIALFLGAGCGGGGGTTAQGIFFVPSPTPSPTTIPFPIASSAPIASNGSVLFPGSSPGRTIRIDTGDGVPAAETITFHGNVPLGVLLVGTFLDGVVFEVGPNTVPLSAIKGVTFDFGTTPPAGRIGAILYQGFGPLSSGGAQGAGAVIPLAMAPSTTFQSNGVFNGAPLTTLTPATQYFLFIGFM